MIWTAAAIIGAGYGAYAARRRGGRGLDMLQYAAGFGIAFGLAGLILGVILDRLG